MENLPRVGNDSCIDYEDRLAAWRNEISRSESALESQLSIHEEVKDESRRQGQRQTVKRSPYFRVFSSRLILSNPIQAFAWTFG